MTSTESLITLFTALSHQPLERLSENELDSIVKGLLQTETLLKDDLRSGALYELQEIIIVLDQKGSEEKLLPILNRLREYKKDFGLDDNALELLKNATRRMSLHRDCNQERIAEGEHLNEQEKQAKDIETLSFSGLVFIFEYNAALLLTYAQADAETKSTMCTSATVKNVGFTAPGIFAGIQNEKTYTEFIGKLHNDELRTKLADMYYAFKSTVLTCEPGSAGVQNGLQQFVLAMLPYFQTYGFEQLSKLWPPHYNISTMTELKQVVETL